MKNRFENALHVEGLVYNHKLEEKVTGDQSKTPGVNYIRGEVNIAIDDACLNIVPVYFTYASEKTKDGKSNPTYETLKNIIDRKIGTYMEDGADKAGKVRIDGSVGANEFWSDRNGPEELVTAQRNEGSFIHSTPNVTDKEDTRGTFSVDMAITGVQHVEANDEGTVEEHCEINGYTFNYRKIAVPLTFVAKSPEAMRYFDSIDASMKNPFCTKVWGGIVNQIIKKETHEESAFGGDIVRETQRSTREYVITGAAKEPYVWDDTSFITKEEFEKALADREVELAANKQRTLDNRNKTAPAMKPASVFDF